MEDEKIKTKLETFYEWGDMVIPLGEDDFVYLIRKQYADSSDEACLLLWAFWVGFEGFKSAIEYFPNGDFITLEVWCVKDRGTDNEQYSQEGNFANDTGEYWTYRV